MSLLLGLIPESPLNQEKMSRVRSFNEDGLFRNFQHKYGLPNKILGKNKKRDVRGGETKNWIGKCSDNDNMGSFHLVDLIITELKDNMTSYKFECSRWLKLQHSDWRANLVKWFFYK